MAPVLQMSIIQIHWLPKSFYRFKGNKEKSLASFQSFPIKTSNTRTLLDKYQPGVQTYIALGTWLEKQRKHILKNIEMPQTKIVAKYNFQKLFQWKLTIHEILKCPAAEKTWLQIRFSKFQTLSLKTLLQLHIST